MSTFAPVAHIVLLAQLRSGVAVEECSAFPKCVKLSLTGNCCPSNGGKMLDCCTVPVILPDHPLPVLEAFAALGVAAVLLLFVFVCCRLRRSNVEYHAVMAGSEESGRPTSCCLGAFCAALSHELTPDKLALSVLPYEREWRKQYGESMCSSGRIFNLVMKSTYLLVMLYAQYVSTFNWGPNLKFYGIYLTYWTLTVQNVYHAANLCMAFQAVHRSEPLNGTVEVTTALRTIAQPNALIVALAYWSGSGLLDTSLQNVMVHGINAVVIILDAATGKQTNRLLNSVWAFVYMLAYIAWTYVHYQLELGTSHGNEWIYECFNWDELEGTFQNLGIIFGAILPAAVLIMWSLVWVRDRGATDFDWQEASLLDEAVKGKGEDRVGGRGFQGA